jgi:hypothetical protein
MCRPGALTKHCKEGQSYGKQWQQLKLTDLKRMDHDTTLGERLLHPLEYLATDRNSKAFPAKYMAVRSQQGSLNAWKHKSV